MGDGLARDEGLVYFVPNTAPGDVVEVLKSSKKKNLCRVTEYKLISAGESRREASCPVYDKCGGCQWQHINYDEQLKQKQQLVTEQLRRFIDESVEVLPILSGPEWQYRNRIQVHVDGPRVGFHEKASDRIVTAEHCQIADPNLLKKLSSLAGQKKGRYEIYLQDNEQAAVRSAEESEERENSSFSQVNEVINQKMLAQILSVMSAPEYVYDLYSGSGNIAFPILQSLACPVEMVELSEKLCFKSQARIREAGWQERATVHQMSVENFLKSHDLKKDSTVIVDPPRPGMNAKICEALNQGAAREILYISCNPSALARDLSLLTAYKLQKVQAFDMFPQSYHVESMVLLQKRR